MAMVPFKRKACMGVLEENPIQNEMQMLMKFTRFENGERYGVQGT